MKISDWLKRLVEFWGTYWFSPLSLQRLAFCRLLAFGLLVLDMVYFQTELFGSKTDPTLWHPILVLRVLHRVFGFGPPPPSVVETIAFLTVILAIGAFVGYRTQVCALTGTLLYVYLVAVKYSSFARVHHTRGAFVLLLLALALSPCGEALSVDALLKRMRVAVGRMRFSIDWKPAMSRYAGWPLRLIGIIVCLVYFSSGYAKFQKNGLDWANGYTLAYAILQDTAIQDTPLEGISETLPLIVAQQVPLLAAMQFFVLFWQITFPVILFVPKLRWFYLPAGLGFHLGTYILMNTHFIWLWFTYMVFIDWDTVGRWLKARFAIGLRPPSVDVIYDGACPLCIRSMTLIAYLDWFRSIRYLDLMDWEVVSKNHPRFDKKAGLAEMHVIDLKTGKLYKGFFGFRRLAWETPLLWLLLPFLYIPGISAAGDRVYSVVAGNRLRLEEGCTRHTCQ